MKRKYAKLMSEMNSDVSYRKSYSGRGMYGDDTAAVTGESWELNIAARDALKSLVGDAINDGKVNKVDNIIQEFFNDVIRGKRDSMGLGEVWY